MALRDRQIDYKIDKQKKNKTESENLAISLMCSTFVTKIWSFPWTSIFAASSLKNNDKKVNKIVILVNFFWVQGDYNYLLKN